MYFSFRQAYCYIVYVNILVDRESSVSVPIRYGLGGPEIEYQWGDEIIAHPSWDPPSLLYNGYRVFPGGKTAGAWR